MADGDRVRVEIGFEGGQVIGGFVDAAPPRSSSARCTRTARASSCSTTEDGAYHVVVPQVAYFRRFNRSSRVGFGTG